MFHLKYCTVYFHIVIGVTMIHFNEKYFPEPYVFRPERFIGAENDDRPPTAFIPFSYGSRY